MSQNVSTDPTVEPPAPRRQTSESRVEAQKTDAALTRCWFNEFSLESYADQVMDDLFGDLDQALERGTMLPVASETKRPEQPKTDESLSLVVAPATASVMPSNEAEASTALAEPDDELSEDELTLLQDDAIAQPKPEKSYWFDRLMLVTACFSLAVTGALWFWLSYFNRAEQAASQDAVVTAANSSINPADRQFLNYVERSLNAIDRRAEASRVASGTPPANGQPPLVASNPSTNNGPPQVLERVYVPLYQPPPPSAGSTVTVSPLPSLPTVSLPNLAQTAPNAPTAPNIASATVTNTLVGVLELGDRSAALFDINGVTQRIHIGEAIGSSGWTLVSVSNQEALVRRNGEVRSIYVGQRF